MRRALVLAAVLSLAAPAAATDWVAYYHEHVAKFREENAALDASRRYVVLVGDSLTEGWSAARVRRFLPAVAPNVLVRGISSDGVGVNARGVLHRLDESIFDCRPSHVLLCIGVNDIGKDGRGVAPAARALEQVVAAVRERAPDVVLVLITLAPTRGSAAAYNPHIVAFNERVRALATRVDAPLVDLHALVRDAQGELPEASATRDGLHWTDAVYQALGPALERVVAAHSRRGRRR